MIEYDNDIKQREYAKKALYQSPSTMAIKSESRLEKDYSQTRSFNPELLCKEEWT